MPGRVLIITERFHPEEFIVNDLAAEWRARGFEVGVLTQAPSYPRGKVFDGYRNSLFSREDWKGIRIARFFTVTGYRDSLALKLLNYLSFAVAGTVAALFEARKYDRIFVYQTGPLTLALPAVFGGLVYGRPVSIWTQDVWPDTVYDYGFTRTRLLSWFLDRLVKFVYSGCGRVFVSCEGFRKKLEPYAAGRQIDWFPNWPTVTPGGEGPGALKLSEKFNFTFAGNVGKVQNLENVIRGFGLASAINGSIQLNIVGDGSNLEALRALVREERIGGVVFWGRKKQEEMPAYFNASDVMVISLDDKPVFNITVPAKFQAYLAFSKPVLCAMNGEVREMVSRYGIGRCADPRDTAAISRAFLAFFEERGEGLKGYAANAATLLTKVYSRDKIIGDMTARVFA